MLPRVQRIRRGARVLCYHRPTGTRLPDLPEDHPDFIAAWAIADARKVSHAPPAEAGTLEAWVRALKTSDRWSDLSGAYRLMMTRHLDVIMTVYGKAPGKGLRPKHIEADLIKLRPNPANHRLRAWRLLLSYAKSHALVEEDVSFSVRKLQVKSAGHATWTPQDVQLFRAHWPAGSIQRAAFELLAWTGARVSDAVTLGPRNIGVDGLLTFTQIKTGGASYVPWTCTMPQWATSWEAERATVLSLLTRPGDTWLELTNGSQRSVKGLSNLISGAARDAGVTGKSAHGLRKYRLTMIAEAGGSSHAIMAWGGHSSLSEAERYTRAAAKKRLVMG